MRGTGSYKLGRLKLIQEIYRVEIGAYQKLDKAVQFFFLPQWDVLGSLSVDSCEQAFRALVYNIVAITIYCKIAVCHAGGSTQFIII